MRLLVIWRRLSIGGINSGWRNRAIFFSRNGITTDFLFTEDKDGRTLIEDIANYYIANDPNEIKQIILENQYHCVIIVDYREMFPILQDINFGGKIILESRVPLKGFVYHQFEHISKISPSLIIVPSKFQKGLVEYSLQKKEIPIKVLHNTIDTEFFKPSLNGCSTQTNYVPENKKIIGWIGNLINQQKQWKFLIKTARTLVQRRKDVHFWVIGGKQSDEKDEFMKQVNEFGLNDYLDWYPSIEYQEQPLIYNQISKSGGCLFSTTKRESFGNIFTEAMACKCPIVAPKITAVPEVVNHNKTGLLYKPKSLKSAVQQLNEVLDHPSKRKQLIEEGYSEVQKKFSFQTSAKNYLETLLEVVENRLP